MASVAETGDRNSINYSEIALRVVREIGVITPDHRRAIYASLLQSGISIESSGILTQLEGLRQALENVELEEGDRKQQLKSSAKDAMDKLERIRGERFQIDLAFLNSSPLNEARLEISTKRARILKEAGVARKFDDTEVTRALYKAMCFPE